MVAGPALQKRVISAGPGGVKTTTSATLGLAGQARETGLRVTVDPAKRLAEALGVTLDNSPSE